MDTRVLVLLLVLRLQVQSSSKLMRLLMQLRLPLVRARCVNEVLLSRDCLIVDSVAALIQEARKNVIAITSENKRKLTKVMFGSELLDANASSASKTSRRFRY